MGAQRPGAGIAADLRARAACYACEWRIGCGGFARGVLPAAVYIFLASALPAIAFGQQLADDTGECRGSGVRVCSARVQLSSARPRLVAAGVRRRRCVTASSTSTFPSLYFTLHGYHGCRSTPPHDSTCTCRRLTASTTLHTEGTLTVVHVLISTAIAGVTQSLVGGQPLLIIGVAEPIVLIYGFWCVLCVLCVLSVVFVVMAACWRCQLAAGTQAEAGCNIAAVKQACTTHTLPQLRLCGAPGRPGRRPLPPLDGLGLRLGGAHGAGPGAGQRVCPHQQLHAL